METLLVFVERVGDAARAKQGYRGIRPRLVLLVVLLILRGGRLF